MRRSGAEASSATSVGLLTTVEVLCPRYSPQSRIGSEVRLEFSGLPRSNFLCAFHVRSWLSCLNHFWLGIYRLLQGGDHLARTTNCLKIILLVDPSTLRCDGV